MKKARNLVVIFSLLMFVGSLTSCTGSRGAKRTKTKKKKRCNCPKWSDVEQQKNQDEVIAFAPENYQDCISL